MRMKHLGIMTILLAVLCGRVSAQLPAYESDSALRSLIRIHADSLFNGTWFMQATGYRKGDSTEIDTILIDRKEHLIRIMADEQLSWAPFRTATVDTLEKGILAGSGLLQEGFRVRISSAGKDLREYVPNYYRAGPKEMDPARRIGKLKRKSPPLVTELSRPYLSSSALSGMHVALWHSHGWYYEPSLHRWEWQRARIFQTVEDLYSMAYTLQMLVPMLENAGAGVLLPRERDWQVREAVVDNNGSTGSGIYVSSVPGMDSTGGTGFALGSPPYVDENPFRLGTYEKMEAARKAGASVQWIPDIPETGDYAVYVSYHASAGNADDARYRVHHTGGVTEFSVNQQMGGGTWIYLGRFRFEQGLNPDRGKVVLTNESRKRKAVITADAVRFGGGMGNIARNGITGLRPRYQEAARYYLQYAGFPDSLVWKLNDPEHDYKDDYQSRGEWVSYLVAGQEDRPQGPGGNSGEGDPDSRGLGIPVDLSLAFHTDAGITDNDTVIGTLGIYSTSSKEGPYPSGLSRMASRDLADLVQTQIVNDIRALYDPAWTRRGLWDKPYSEASRPAVPSMLLELSSHQNLLDMRFGQEPMFRFHACRAIYKGMLKFLSSLYGTEYLVQPLPVTHFRTSILPSGAIRLSWRPQDDPLEATAQPEDYRVYTRINGAGFDNGRTLSDTVLDLEDLYPDSIYSFRVTALNGGGESFPSEVLSLCNKGDAKGKMLIVNAFDRTGGAAWFEDTAYAGFLPMVDQGVPWQVDLHTVGAQYDYRRSSPWLDDDSPGHGASYADMEELVIPGNSFDFSYTHGLSMVRAGYSFASVSDEALPASPPDPGEYVLVDYLAGEERSTFLPREDSMPLYQVLPDPLPDLLGAYLEKGGKLFISGAHIASDLHERGQDFLAVSLLKYRWRTSNACRTGRFYFSDPGLGDYAETFAFNAGYHPSLYTVEGADALEPADSTSHTIIRYRENNMSAGVGYKGSYALVAVGFPFESIVGQEDRDEFMRRILHYLLGR